MDNSKQTKTATNKQSQSTQVDLGKCNLCDSPFIPGKFGPYCPNYKEHKAKGEKPYAIKDPVDTSMPPF